MYVCVLQGLFVSRFSMQFAFLFFFLWEKEKRAETLAKLWCVVCVCYNVCSTCLLHIFIYMQYVFFFWGGSGGQKHLPDFAKSISNVCP